LMSNQVFANMMEVSCKAASGKTICAFPDVCMTPPQTPATPPGVPVPYPNTGMASDCSDGSSTVKISGEEVMLKNKSYFKKSTGDEAGCAPKKGVITSSTKGKVYFVAWSMDVKVEGENVVRHLDMSTGNHACPTANEAAPFPYADAMAALSKFDSCKNESEKVGKSCKDKNADPCPGVLKKGIVGTRSKIKAAWNKKGGSEISGTARLASSATKNAEGRGGECARAMRCLLRPYSATPRDGVKGCCPGQTPHHIPPHSTTSSVKGLKSMPHGQKLCVCLEGANHSVGSHGKHHHGINYLMREKAKVAGSGITGGPEFYSGSLREHIKVSAAVTEAQTQKGCSKECIEEQLNKQYKEHLDKPAVHNGPDTGGTGLMDADSSAQEAAMTAMNRPPFAPAIPE
jgi:hypothetical protein